MKKACDINLTYAGYGSGGRFRGHTSSLDPENEAQIQQAISRLVKGRTVIVIAHRLKTVASADMILVLDQRRIVEEGNHKQLLDLNGLYAMEQMFTVIDSRYRSKKSLIVTTNLNLKFYQSYLKWLKNKDITPF